MPRTTTPSLRTIAFICIALLALGGSIAAWMAAANNPRDGWSLAKIGLGMVGPSPSGDRAYHTFTIPNATTSFTSSGVDQTARVMVIGRRTRLGLFVPWHETTDLRAIDMTGAVRDWQTDSTNPSWMPLVAAMLATHQQRLVAATDPAQRAYQQRIVDALQAELAGAYPQRRVMWGAMALDAAGVAAHLALLLMVVLGIRGLIRHGLAEGRTMKGLCPRCGYPMTGLNGPCPECGLLAREQRATLRARTTAEQEPHP